MKLEDKATDAAMMIVGDMGRPDEDYYEAKEGYLQGYKQALKDMMKKVYSHEFSGIDPDDKYYIKHNLEKIAEDLEK